MSDNGCDHRCRGQKNHHQETVDPRLRCIALFGCDFCILRILDSIISILQHWLAIRTIRRSKFIFATLDRLRSSIIFPHHLQAPEFYKHWLAILACRRASDSSILSNRTPAVTGRRRKIFHFKNAQFRRSGSRHCSPWLNFWLIGTVGTY